MHNKAIWKYLAPLFLLSGIGIVLMAFYNKESIDAQKGWWIAVYLVVGISMVWQMLKSKKK